MKSTTLVLNEQQISLLLGVLYEYNKNTGFETPIENQLHNEVTEILENAENEVFSQ